MQEDFDFYPSLVLALGSYEDADIGGLFGHEPSSEEISAVQDISLSLLDAPLL